MADVSGISNLGLPTTSLVESMGDSGFTREGFLKLLIAQIQHQDPLSPMDNEAFIGQLTQFSILEQNMNMNQVLTAQLSMLQSANQNAYNNTAVALIGREVIVAGDRFQYDVGSNDEVMFEAKLPGAVRLQFFDANNQLVREAVVSAQQGFNKFVFDGKDQQGGQLGTGVYTVRANTAPPPGQSSSTLATFVSGMVRAVDFSSGEVYLDVDGITIPADGVIAIRQVQLP